MSIDEIPLDGPIAAPYINTPSLETFKPILMHLVTSVSDPNQLDLPLLSDIYDLESFGITEANLLELFQTCTREM